MTGELKKKPLLQAKQVSLFKDRFLAIDSNVPGKIELGVEEEC